jgi:hypothetical protein
LRVSFPSQLRAKFETPSWKQRIDVASGFSGLAVERNNDGAQRNAGEFLRRCSKEINFV